GCAELIETRLVRLDVDVAHADDYVELIRSAGAVEEWTPFWDAFYRYELAELPGGGWAPSTSRAACQEDLDDFTRNDFAALWPQLSMPVILIRALRHTYGDGFIVPASERDALLAAAPDARLVELDVDHFTVMTDPAVPRAIAACPGWESNPH